MRRLMAVGSHAFLEARAAFRLRRAPKKTLFYAKMTKVFRQTVQILYEKSEKGCSLGDMYCKKPLYEFCLHTSLTG